jgi:hypothetical protein
MRSLARGAIIAAIFLAAAYDVGVYVRADYLGQEPARDIAAGLGVLAVAAAAGWALGGTLAEPERERSDAA